MLLLNGHVQRLYLLLLADSLILERGVQVVLSQCFRSVKNTT